MEPARLADAYPGPSPSRLLTALASMIMVLASCTAMPEQTAAETEPTSIEDGYTPGTQTPDFPPARTDLEHQGKAWAVVLAGSENPLDPELETAERVIEEAGYFAGVTDCDKGAAAALGLPEDSFILTASAYLNSEADAKQALQAFRAGGFPGGVVAEVTTGCLD